MFTVTRFGKSLSGGIYEVNKNLKTKGLTVLTVTTKKSILMFSMTYMP